MALCYDERMSLWDDQLALSLRSYAEGERMTRILAAALDAVDPEKAVLKLVRRDQDHLTFGTIDIDLQAYRRVFIIGAGKASFMMARAVANLVGDKLAKGAVITKAVGLSSFLPGYPSVRVLRGGHPLPDPGSLQGTQVIVDLVKILHPDDLVIGLISGGGSTLLAKPVQGVSLEQLQSLNRTLLACGASVDEINTIRKHLDEVKGGRLAGMVYPARMVTLILSDVIGNPLEVVASGPTVADPTTFDDALAVLAKYQVLDNVPRSIVETLKKGQRGELPETLKAGDMRIRQVDNLVVGSNIQASQAAILAAEQAGFHSLLLTTHLKGEARMAGRFLSSILRQVAETGHPLPRPACLVAGGETTVFLRGEGRGGRNQELALGAVEELRGLKHVVLVTLATDGEDGPTDAAGALVTGETAAHAEAMGVNTQAYLDNNDSYSYFKLVGGLLRTGSTGTNVNDLTFLFAF